MALSGARPFSGDVVDACPEDAPLADAGITEVELADALAVNQELAARLLPVASALVERYAPAAPQSVKDEAVIRTAGWLAEQPHASIRSEVTGEIRTDYNTASLSALRHSGAMALLSPWKVRRAGAI